MGAQKVLFFEWLLFGLGLGQPVSDELVVVHLIEHLVSLESLLVVVFDVLVPDFFLFALVLGFDFGLAVAAFFACHWAMIQDNISIRLDAGTKNTYGLNFDILQFLTTDS